METKRVHKTKFYSFLFGLTALGAGLLLLLLVNILQPSLGAVFLFYALVSIVVFCITTLIALYLRLFFGLREMSNQYLATSIRQGFWFTVLVSVSLFLSSKGLFNWLNALFLILALVFLESYLLVRRNP